LLPEGENNLELFRDRVISNCYAPDYKREIRTVPAGEKLTVQLASGICWVARIDPVKKVNKYCVKTWVKYICQGKKFM